MSSAPVVATIGAFDGIHRGHQQLLGQVVDRARALGVASLGVTFAPHPDTVMYPERGFTYLTDRAHTESLLRGMGIDHIMVLRFTRELSMLRPEEFIALLQSHHPLAELWIGSDFAMGRDRSGTISVLVEIGRTHGFAVHVVPPRRLDHEIISSTVIRSLLRQGELGRANLLLGRRYRLSGVVEHGAARGRQLGFPTANVRLAADRTLPADGVYAATTEVDGREYRTVVNLGSRPTFAEADRLLEAHLLDFDGDLYGRTLDVDFIAKIRDVRRFESLEALREQIARDVEAARGATDAG
jgi:riboflavin kinase/FMN adenylyltransferase